MQELYREIEVKMKGAVDHFQDELRQLRTGRASPVILDGIMVDYYGTPTPLSQLANITVADAQMLVAQPYDATQIAAMERAIQVSNLGLNPSNDGKVIRIPIPTLTEERRKKLVKDAHGKAEDDALKKMTKDKEIGEDDEHRGHDEMQRLHDHYIKQINEKLEAKEKEIMTV